MTLSTSNASALTAEQVQKILVKPLEDKSVFLASGPRIFDTDGSPIRIPKLGGEFSPEWVGENELIPVEDDLAFDEITLMPSTMKSVKTITRFSNELARQSVVSLDATLKDRLVTDVANKLDRQFLSALGDGITTPKGILSYAGQTIDAAGALTLDTLLDAWSLALSSNVDTSRLRYFMSPATFTSLRKIKDTSGQYVVNQDPTADATFRLFGTPVTITGRIGDAGSVILADMSQIAVARDVNSEVKLLTERYADYDQLALRVVSRFDVAPLNDEAIIVIDGITN